MESAAVHADAEQDVGDSLDEYVQQLQACLRWDPASNTKGEEKQDFVEALTEIAALPLDSISMEIRRLLVVGGKDELPKEAVGADHSRCDSDSAVRDNPALANLIAALRCRDVLLKCKAANAMGSLCISRVAGQRLLDAHGDVVLKSLVKMATCKNKWAQGDAFFVLGWIIVIGDDAMLKQIARLVPSVIRFLHRSVTEEDASSTTAAAAPAPRSDAVSSEEASNFRIYALVLLLNFMQRDVAVFASETQHLMVAMHAIVHKLNSHAVAEIDSDAGTREASASGSSSFDCFEPSEFVELLRLTITFLSLLVDQVSAVPSLILEMKMLPSLLKLSRVLGLVQEADLLCGDDEEAMDLKERMAAIIETIVSCR